VVKRGPGREFDHSPPSSADVENEWSLTSISPIGLHGIGGDNFTSMEDKTLSFVEDFISRDITCPYNAFI